MEGIHILVHSKRYHHQTMIMKISISKIEAINRKKMVRCPGMDTYLPNDENDELNDNNMRFTDDYLKRNKAKVIKQHKTAIVSSTKKHKKNGVRRKFKNNDNNNINENYYNDKKKRSVNRMRSENLENIMLDFQGDSKDNEDNSLENAKLAQAIIHSILKDSVPGTRRELGICQKKIPENFINRDIEIQERKMVEGILRSVEEALLKSLNCKDCLTLHTELAEFLAWLLTGQSTVSCCMPIDRLHHNSNNYFLFHPSHCRHQKIGHVAIPPKCANKKNYLDDNEDDEDIYELLYRRKFAKGKLDKYEEKLV
ncbi:hypothetical protein O3M35_009861 [Rhynocoris fuscipes]|uniref:Uncharacterized protein n=1 Tax=Rhynocoris fuscipes TaxID=488301 RepID=A0AAW1D575_9HEMI